MVFTLELDAGATEKEHPPLCVPDPVCVADTVNVLGYMSLAATQLPPCAVVPVPGVAGRLITSEILTLVCALAARATQNASVEKRISLGMGWYLSIARAALSSPSE
jgi:hypothetical protein